MLYIFAMFNASFLLLAALLIIPLLQLSLNYTHTSVSNICIYHFYWGFAPNETNMWNKWKNHFSEMKGDVGMSPHEKEGEQEDAYTKTRNSFITPSIHLCFFLMCSYLLFVDKNTECMQLIPC